MKVWMKGLMVGGAMALALPAFAAEGAGTHPGTPSPQTGAVEQKTLQYTGVVKEVDQDKKMVTLQLPLAPNVAIMKDGQRASLGDIKEGDDVRASFDPMSKKINRIDIQTKGPAGVEPMQPTR